MATKDVLGRNGEELAARYLEQQGLVVLSRNWRCRAGELDVVAVENGRLVVCEVKTRSSARFGTPLEAVDERRIARIRRATQAWLATHRVRWCEVRYDVLAILAEPGTPVSVEHFRGVL